MPKVTSDGYLVPVANDPANYLLTFLDWSEVLYHKECGVIVFDKAAHEAWHKRMEDA